LGKEGIDVVDAKTTPDPVKAQLDLHKQMLEAVNATKKMAYEQMTKNHEYWSNPPTPATDSTQTGKPPADSVYQQERLKFIQKKMGSY